MTIDIATEQRLAARRVKYAKYYAENLEFCRERARVASRKYREKNNGTAHLRRARIAKYTFWQCRGRARKKGLDFDLTPEWIAERYMQGSALSGLPFSFGTRKSNSFSASVDRVDNCRGYTQDNCRLILNAENRFKGDLCDEEMLRIAVAMLAARETP